MATENRCDKMINRLSDVSSQPIHQRWNSHSFIDKSTKSAYVQVHIEPADKGLCDVLAPENEFQVPHSNHAMPTSCDPKTRQRVHAERMLARAERRSRQALQLVEKWKTKLTDLDREGIAAKQAILFADDRPGAGK